MSYARYDKNVTQSVQVASVTARQQQDKMPKGRLSVDHQQFENEGRAFKQFRSNNINKIKTKDQS